MPVMMVVQTQDLHLARVTMRSMTVELLLVHLAVRHVPTAPSSIFEMRRAVLDVSMRLCG